MSGEAFSTTQSTPSGEIATELWLITGMVPARASAQFGQAQFHWGKPPPAAAPSIFTCIAAESERVASVAIVFCGAVHVDFHTAFHFAGLRFRPGHDSFSFAGWIKSTPHRRGGNTTLVSYRPRGGQGHGHIGQKGQDFGRITGRAFRLRQRSCRRSSRTPRDRWSSTADHRCTRTSRREERVREQPSRRSHPPWTESGHGGC